MFYPSVAVIVPIYNGAEDLPGLLQCLQAQTYPPQRVTYYLVDNNSQDSTAQALAEAARHWPLLHPLAEAEIQSSYAARNQGIRSSQGEILAFTDADCRPEPQWLEQLVQPFQEGDVAVVVGELVALPGSHWLERYAQYRDVMNQRYTLGHPLGAYGQTANLAVRRSAFALAGLFRPHLTTGGDADLCWRVQRSGAGRVEFAARAIVAHRHRSTWSALREQWRRYGTSNHYLHQIHGAKLQPPPNPRHLRYLLARWFLKEVPLGLWRWAVGGQDWVAIVATPVDQWCDRERYRSQQRAILPEKAWEIPAYTPEPPPPAP
jgi:cellulose synthase/poly-beta-1,6-N-acetylglucosamine synthase-like glycosyltransferase